VKAIVHGWGLSGSVTSVYLQTEGSRVRSFGQRAAANCAAPPSIIGGQYDTSNCKPLLVRVSLSTPRSFGARAPLPMFPWEFRVKLESRGYPPVETARS